MEPRPTAAPVVAKIKFNLDDQRGVSDMFDRYLVLVWVLFKFSNLLGVLEYTGQNTVKFWGGGMSYFVLDAIDISSLLKAYASFDEAINTASSVLEKDGTVQRFEYTYELFWKTIKRVLEVKGKNCNSPRDVFREAALQGIIDDPEFWFEVIKKRNLTAHTYERKVAESIYSAFQEIRDGMLIVINRLKKL